jgi:hypothetical protein
MSSTDNRSGFRLPWQGSNAAPTNAETAAGTAVADTTAWPSHDLARRRQAGAGNGTAQSAEGTAMAGDASPGTADAVTSADGTTADTAMQTTSPTTDGSGATDAGAGMTTDVTTEMTTTATTEHGTDTARTWAPTSAAARPPTRKPTAFLAELTRAMRQAADEARRAALAQFKTDVDRHGDEARTSCSHAADEARARADTDVAELGEWEQREIERIRQEASDGVTARQVRLEEELARQQSHLDDELVRVQAQVAGFEAEMDAFFQGLLAEEDPARFAAMAERLPEPPAFAAWTPAAESSVTAPAAVDVASAGFDASALTGASASGSVPTADEATTAAIAIDETTADEFAAAEAEAAQWATGDASADEAVQVEATAEEQVEAAETEESLAETEAPVATDEPAQPPTETRTQVAVIGLVSVASIATFKRMLARTPGVRGVQVASGPDGEFLFTATHESTVDMPAAVSAIQGFEIQVVESGPGIVSAQAVDPEVV